MRGSDNVFVQIILSFCNILKETGGICQTSCPYLLFVPTAAWRHLIIQTKEASHTERLLDIWILGDVPPKPHL